MRGQKLTKSAIDAFAPGDKDAIFWDAELKGFGCKVTPRGKKVFLVQYRMGGAGSPVRKVTLGTYGVLTVQVARDMAIGVLAKARQGIDTAAQKRAARTKPRDDRIDALFEAFRSGHLSQRRTAAQADAIFRRDILPSIGPKPAKDVSKHDILTIIDRVRQRGSDIMANRVLADVRKFFNWLVARDVIGKSPCEGIGRPVAERSRDRVLTEAELARILEAAEATPYPFGQIVMLLAYTGQRRDEVASMKWSEIDIDKALWTIPAHRAKNGKVHDVHLACSIIALIKTCPKSGDYVVSLSPNAPFKGWSKAKSALDRASGTSGWRLHDFRRTMVTYMAKQGVAHHVADRILNHKNGVIGGVAAVYQRHEFANERKQALEAWASYLSELSSAERARHQ
jgi:integrase